MAIIRCSSLASPYPQETIYSWLSRRGLLSGCSSDRQFLKQAMSYSGQQLSSMFPIFIRFLVENSNISAEKSLIQHSVLPYFRMFTYASVYENVFESLKQSTPIDAYARLSLLANRIPESKYFYYCPLCLEEGLNLFGVGYWHVEHQLPWVGLCYKHQAILCFVVRKRKRLRCPPQCLSYQSQDMTCRSMNNLELSQNSEVLWKSNLQALSLERVNQCYLKAL